jgi:hypothetical protein
MRAMATRVATTLVALMLAALGAGCDGDETVPTTGTPPPPETATTAVYFLRDGKIAPVRRAIPASEDPELATVSALLEGPTADEREGGLVTAIPATTVVESVSVEDGVATVDLSRDFDNGGGSASMLGRVAQVVATLTRFPTVKRVAFRLDGETVKAIGGEGVVVDPPIGRLAIEDQTPQILIESPLPGDTVSSPIRLQGTANVFEATVSIEARDQTGTVVLQAFTTATSGTGTRGTFDTKLTMPTASGTMTIIAFEASAENGEPLHVVDVQVTVEQ